MEEKEVKTHKLNQLFWLWEQDASKDPQEIIFLSELLYCRVAMLEKAYGKYQGSKQDERFRFLHYGESCVYDFLRMVKKEGADEECDEK